MTFRLNINDKFVEVDAEPDSPLLWVLRDQLGLTGTKFGCGMAQCGSCTVHIDGQSMRSCSVPVESVGNSRIRTIEGLSSPVAKAVQTAWVDFNVAQCGYCQSGQIMSAVALLEHNATPSDSDIEDAMNGNICRCGTYHRVRQAIHAASNKAKG